LWFIFSFIIGSTLTKLWAKAFQAMVSASTSAASSIVVALLEGVLLGCFLLGLYLPGGNISLVLRRSDDDDIGAVSFLRALLWKSWACFACGVLASRVLEDWRIGRRIS
jgi:hypothetical protein